MGLTKNQNQNMKIAAAAALGFIFCSNAYGFKCLKDASCTNFDKTFDQNFKKISKLGRSKYGRKVFESAKYTNTTRMILHANQLCHKMNAPKKACESLSKIYFEDENYVQLEQCRKKLIKSGMMLRPAHPVPWFRNRVFFYSSIRYS